MKILGHRSPSPWTRREKLARAAWVAVEATLFRLSPRPLHGWRRMLLRIFGARIGGHDGPGARIAPSARVHFPWNLTLEAGTMVGPGVRLYNLAPVALRRGANLSQRVHVCAGTHDYNRWEMPLAARPVEIGENVWIAAEAFIGPGVRIGELAVIGARSVVMRDIPARTIAAGNPCQPLRPRSEPV
ncbi:MAG: putative colanic acid biosynthesis acetyltransferase [Opitutus sp.]|nr:putative colanic acid biosynthesis acetyltransferase [Opitutus sp.]